MPIVRRIEGLREYFQAELKEDQDLSPLGAILYDGGKQLYVIGSIKDRMIVGHAKENEFDRTKVDTKSDRILDLSQYSDVMIERIGLSGRKFESQTALRNSKKEYWATLYFIDSSDPQQKKEHILKFEGQQLLKSLIGEEGGIAVFAGDGNPKDTALIVNIPNGDAIHSVVCFMRPDNGDLTGMDSLNGLYEFTKGLNSEFGKLNNKEINRINSAVEKAVRDAEMQGKDADSNLRIEIFKAQCAAYILLSEITGNTKYIDKLYELLPEMKPGEKSWFAGFGNKIENAMIQRVLDVPIGQVFVDDYVTPKPVNTAKTVERVASYEAVQNQLVSEKIRIFSDEYHVKLKDAFYTGNNEYIAGILDNYWKEVLAFLRDEDNTMTEEELLDMVNILHDMRETIYFKEKFNCSKLDRDSPDRVYLSESTYFNYDNSDYANTFYFSGVIPRLIKIAQKKAGIKAAASLSS